MALTPSDYAYIRQLVRENTAIVVDKGKDYLIESRLARVARMAGFASIEGLLAHLRSSAFDRLHLQVVEAMTTNETSFFRDLYPFVTLQKHILPELVRQRQAERHISIWSAACSSGQEPYSIAMVIAEHAAVMRDWTVRLVASDISTEMLAVAQEGVYSDLQVSRGLLAPLLDRYFDRRDTGWQVKDHLRRMVEFYQINLGGRWPPLPRFDVIFLRNVLYYFDDSTKKAVLNKMVQLMKPESYLFLGATETPIFLNNSFARVTFGKAVCYKVRGAREGAAADP